MGCIVSDIPKQDGIRDRLITASRQFELKLARRSWAGKMAAISMRTEQQPHGVKFFEETIGRRGFFGRVAFCGPYACGMVFYEIKLYTISIHYLIVDAHWKNQGVGSLLIADLQRRCGGLIKRELEFVVDDRKTDLHLFLRSQGFRAEGISHRDDGRDFYHFEWKP